MESTSRIQETNEDLELRKRIEEIGAVVEQDLRLLEIERSAEQDASRREAQRRADDLKSAEENAKFLGLEWRPRCACGCNEPVGPAKNGRFPRFRERHNFQRTCGGRAHSSPEWKAYHYAKTRCRNRKRKDYANYGGRGILFCFVSFEQFLNEVGPKPGPEYTLDRIEVNDHYRPGNVKWSTPSEQNANRRPREEWNFKNLNEGINPE